MSRFKDFGTGSSSEKAPLSFKIHGEEFHCSPEIQGKLLLQVINSGSDDAGDNAAATKLITDFFKYVLLAESYTRFDALLEDPERIVSIDTLTEIIGWLMEEYAGRPEEQPEASSTGE